MSVFLILPGYLIWHYTAAWRDYLRVWGSLLWFINHQLSLTLLLRTLFAPWKRMTEGKPAQFDLEQIAETVVVNIMSRIVGAIVRLFILCVGLILLLLTLAAGLLGLVFWLAAPLWIVGLFAGGVYFLF